MYEPWKRIVLPAALMLVGALSLGAQVQAQPTERIHAVGYSVTLNAICGTQGLFFLDPSGEECRLYAEYGGGTVPRWWSEMGPPPGLKWRIFRNGIEWNGVPSVIYWQIGFIRQSSAAITPGMFEVLVGIADQIRTYAPGATIYVSGMSPYTPALCERVTAASVEKSWNAAGLLWGSAPDIEMGPVLPAITPAHTSGSGDSCHLGPAGKALHGSIVQQFFEAVLASE